MKFPHAYYQFAMINKTIVICYNTENKSTFKYIYGSYQSFSQHWHPVVLSKPTCNMNT